MKRILRVSIVFFAWIFVVLPGVSLAETDNSIYEWQLREFSHAHEQYNAKKEEEILRRAAKTKELRSVETKLKKEYAKIQTKVQKQKNDLKSFEKKVKELMKITEQKKKEYNQQLDAHKDVLALFEKQQSEFDDLQGKIIQQKEEIQNQEQENFRLQEVNAKKKEEHQQWQDKFKELEGFMETQKQEREVLQEKIDQEREAFYGKLFEFYKQEESNLQQQMEENKRRKKELEERFDQIPVGE